MSADERVVIPMRGDDRARRDRRPAERAGAEDVDLAVLPDPPDEDAPDNGPDFDSSA